MRDEDDHIFKIVNKESKVKNVFVSIYGDINSKDNQRIINKIKKWENYYQRKYYIYDASSAKVWDSKNNFNDCNML